VYPEISKIKSYQGIVEVMVFKFVGATSRWRKTLKQLKPRPMTKQSYTKCTEDSIETRTVSGAKINGPRNGLTWK
jgi:hypothetical protein